MNTPAVEAEDGASECLICSAYSDCFACVGIHCDANHISPCSVGVTYKNNKGKYQDPKGHQ
jgi:hypothetical protein